MNEKIKEIVANVKIINLFFFNVLLNVVNAIDIEKIKRMFLVVEIKLEYIDSISAVLIFI
jgi:hypothetical protein